MVAAPLALWLQGRCLCLKCVSICVATQDAVFELACFSVWGHYVDAHLTGNTFQSFRFTGKINEEHIWLKA